MAISFVGSEQNDTGGDTTVNVAVPTGVQDGDVLIALYGNGQTSGTAPDITGWTLIGYVEDDSYNNNTAACFYRVASEEPGGYDMDYPGSTSNQTSGIIAAFRGVHADVLDVTYVQGSHYFKDQNTTTPQPASITTQTDGAVVITMMWCGDTSITAINPPSGYAEAEQIIAGNRYAQLSYKLVSSAGSETPGTISLVSGAGTEDPAMFTIALKPASAEADTSGASIGVGIGSGIGVGIA